ncbi:MAG: putative transport system permease protein [Blastocatellia bacterium]|jgi:putative ABC transport system permease protein|nr:putative transport system permease protein [Blastocatellia bacterium]
MQSFWQDLRYAARTLVKRPGFTLIAVMTLALGIGASTALFTVVDAALLRGLPYKSPDRLYHLWEKTPQKEYGQREFSYPDYQDYQQNTVFEGLAAYTGGGAILSGSGEPEPLAAPSASANFFSVLGVEATLGRTFQPSEDKPGAPRVTVLTYGLWQRKFGGDPAVLNKALTLNGERYIVIGVLPASFQFALRPADLWLPYQPTQNQLTRRFMHGTNLIARLKPDVSVAQAQTELSTIASRIEHQYNDSHAGTGATLISLQEQVVGSVRPILVVLLAAVGFVLLIACANVASLLLTRSLARHKEVAIRAALGANRWRVVRQMLTESLLLSVMGGAAGFLVAFWGVPALVAAIPMAQLSAMPFLKSSHVDASILAFSFALSLLTGLVFGLVPALQSSRLDLNEVLKEGGRNASAGAGHRVRSALVITEIALAVVLLVGAGLMMKSLLHLLQVNVGFKTQNLLTMTVILPASKYSEANRQVSFNQELTEHIQSLPGVDSAGTVNILPLNGGNTTRFNVEGDPIPSPGQEIEANIRTVDESYFRTLGIPVISGRMFDARDKGDAPGVVMIGKNVADRLFAGRDPIGKRLVYTGTKSPPDLIVGVVGDVKITGLDEAVKPVLYYPFRQSPAPVTTLVVRTSSNPNTLVSSVRNEIRSLEPEVAFFNVRTMEEMISTTPASFMRRFPALLIGIFAGVALLLASIGIYGVVSYSVTQQTHYIGVRLALGAQAFDILKMVLKQGLVLALAGVAIGVVAALALMRLMSSLLFEVKTTDVGTFAIVVGTLLGVALLACYLPARRATKVDPLVALRYE